MRNSVSLRNADSSDSVHLAEIIVAATRSAFADRVPEACLNALSIDESATNWEHFFASETLQKEREILLVADHHDEGPIAFILAGRDTKEVMNDPSIAYKYPREITSLQVNPVWHGKGIGRRLIEAVASTLLAQDTKPVAVRVLEPNPNKSFYTHLGTCQISSQPYDWDGFVTEELIFGWQNIGDVKPDNSPRRDHTK